MTGGGGSVDQAAGARWTASLLLILGLHAAAVVLLAPQHVDPAATASAEPAMLDLTPEPAAPAAAPVSPPPEQAIAQEPEPTPVAEPPAAAELPQPELLPMPAQPVEAPAAPPSRTPRPPPRPTRAAPARQAPAAPHAAELQAPPVAAPHSPATPTPDPQATASWRSVLLGRLQAAKRYPERARARGDQGVALATFTLDRAGRVLSASLARSSGSVLLDEEAVALIHRAEPLPPPPPGMPGAALTVTVPVSFALR